MKKGPKSARIFFNDSFRFLAGTCVFQPPLCIRKPLCAAVFRLLAGYCTQNSRPFHIFSFFTKTHSRATGNGVLYISIFADEPDLEWPMIDVSHCKVHPHAAEAKSGNQDMSRTKGDSIPRFTLSWMQMVCRSEYMLQRVSELIAKKLFT